MKKLLTVLLLIACSPAFAGIALVQHANNRCASATTCTVALSAVASNDLIVFYTVSNVVGQTTSGPTDSNGTVSAARAYSVSSGVGAGVYYVAATASGTHTFSITYGTSGNIEVFAAEFSGASTSAPFDKVSVMATGSGTSATSAVITPSAANELILGFANGANSGITFSAWGGGMTQQDTISTGPSTAWADVVQTSATNVASSYTLSASASWTSIVAAFAPAAAACTHSGITSTGAISVPNGSTGSYRLKNGSFGTPDCSTVNYFQPTVGNFGVN